MIIQHVIYSHNILGKYILKSVLNTSYLSVTGGYNYPTCPIYTFFFNLGKSLLKCTTMFKFATLAIYLISHSVLHGFMYFLFSWLNFPRNVPFGQCLSPSQSPPTLPPSPLLPSPPPSPMLSSFQLLASHSGRPPGSFSRPGVVQSRRLLPHKLL